MPEINSGLSVEQKNATISVTKDGQFYINGTKIQENDIYNQLALLKPKLEKKEIVVKADENVKSREIMKIMKAAQDAEFDKLIVAGEPLSKKEQTKLQNSNRDTEEKTTTIPVDPDDTYQPAAGEIPSEE